MFKKGLIFLTICIIFWYSTIVKAYENSWELVLNTGKFISSIETTPWGMVMGENDGRVWDNPFNGVYISYDLGRTWHLKGLGERGVTDLHYYDGELYATTYYNQSDIIGLFINSGGETWTHIGPVFSASTVCKDANTIYLGGYSHGLWISTDQGSTWEQKIGGGWFGPRVYEISCSEGIVLTSTEEGLYKSSDYGNSWEKDNYFDLKTIQSIFTDGYYSLVATTQNLIYSKGNENAWTVINFFNDKLISQINKHNNLFFVFSKDNSGTTHTMYISSDLTNWIDTGFNLNIFGKFRDTSIIVSKPSYIYVIFSPTSIYRYGISNWLDDNNSFLEIPWSYTNHNELYDRITAYYDHEYPLLGYNYYSEPEEMSAKTLNFSGERESPPKMYYSSHSGTDFYLDYGEPVKAAYAGNASYYYCGDCGNTIKIDHLNGYQSIYMHLQSEGLITKTDSVEVYTGQIIGKVGLTGNTSGPHLHFEILKDSNNNGIFDDSPDGRVDPFGWFGELYPDPWPGFTWTDVRGNHRGSQSQYLWTYKPPFLTSITTVIGGQYAFENKKVTLDTNSVQRNATLTLLNSTKAVTPQHQENLRYINNSGLYIDLFDLRGDKITSLEPPGRLEIVIDPIDNLDANLAAMKIYSWNNELSEWEPLDTTINTQNSSLEADIYHLSKFAVFAEYSGVLKSKVVIKNAHFGL